MFPMFFAIGNDKTYQADNQKPFKWNESLVSISIRKGIFAKFIGKRDSFIWTVYLFDIKAHLNGRYKINYQVIVEAILL